MILAYYAPFLALFWGLALDGPEVVRCHLGAIALLAINAQPLEKVKVALNAVQTVGI